LVITRSKNAVVMSKRSAIKEDGDAFLYKLWKRAYIR
jgi:hypothetical protein